jgi:hypothetical protein
VGFRESGGEGLAVNQDFGRGFVVVSQGHEGRRLTVGGGDRLVSGGRRGVWRRVRGGFTGGGWGRSLQCFFVLKVRANLERFTDHFFTIGVEFQFALGLDFHDDLLVQLLALLWGEVERAAIGSASGWAGGAWWRGQAVGLAAERVARPSAEGFRREQSGEQLHALRQKPAATGV